MKSNPFQTANVTFYKLTVDGLRLIYTYKGKIVNAFFDPCATADMMKRLGIVEGVDYDQNGEPVILFEKDCDDGEGNWQSTIGFCPWNEFAARYILQDHEAAILAELNEGNKALDQLPVMLAEIFGESNIIVTRA